MAAIVRLDTRCLCDGNDWGVCFWDCGIGLDDGGGAMIRRLLDWLFTREETEAEERFRFYFGDEQSRKWEQYGTRVTGSQILETSRHCQ